MPKLEGIIKSSVQDVLSESMQDILSEFFNEDFLNSLKPNSEPDQNRNLSESNHTENLFAGCPIGWFRILDSCLWVSPTNWNWTVKKNVNKIIRKWLWIKDRLQTYSEMSM